jgi:hypothetical protein
MKIIRAKSNGPPEAACTLPARALSAKGTRSQSGRPKFKRSTSPSQSEGLAQSANRFCPRPETTPGCPILVRALCAAGWDSVAPNQIKAPGAPFWCALFAQQGGIASLPTRSKLRVPHIPGVGMWVSCKARPSCRPKNPLFLACHPERSERTPRLLFAPSTTTPSANINPAQQD